MSKWELLLIYLIFSLYCRQLAYTRIAAYVFHLGLINSLWGKKMNISILLLCHRHPYILRTTPISTLLDLKLFSQRWAFLHYSELDLIAFDAPWSRRKITPACLRRLYKDDLILCSGKKAGALSSVPPASPSPSIQTVSSSADTQNYTESALKELFQQVTNMPESAKKKKLIRQVTGATRSRRTNRRLAAQLTLALLVCLCAVWKTAPVDAHIWFPDALQQETLALALLGRND